MSPGRRRPGRLFLRCGVGAYRLVLRIYPARFRREWGPPMTRVFARRSVEELRRAGRWGMVRWWARAGLDLARSVPAEWRDHVDEGAVVVGRPGTTMTRGRWTMGGSVIDLAHQAGMAVRGLLRARWWTVTALATLVVGVGAVTGVFSLVYESLVRPLPFDQPGRLVTVVPLRAGESEAARRFSLPLLETWQAEEPAGIPVAGYSPTRTPLDLGDGPEYVDAAFATGNLMELLGVSPLLGRRFEPSDGAEGAAPVLALSEELWRSRFGADSGILGRTIALGGESFTVVAVVGPGLDVLAPEALLWIPTFDFPRSPYITVFSAVGRLPAGRTLEVATEGLAALALDDGTGATFSGSLEPLRDTLVGDTRPVLLVFLAVVVGLLLIAGVNLANLFLGRAVARSGDRGIRTALGASRGRLLRGAVMDGAVLGSVGGVGGLLLGMWMRRLVVAWSPEPVPGLTGHGPGVVEAAFAGAVSVGLCALLAVWTAGRAEAPLPLLQAGAPRRTGDRRTRGAQRSLTVVQVAAAFVLVTASALLLVTFERLSSVDPGFDTGRTGGMLVSLPSALYSGEEDRRAFGERLAAALEALPQVERVAGVDRAPLKGLVTGWVEVEGGTDEEGAAGSALLRADPGFLEVLGVPLLRGRGFTPADDPDAPPVAVVTESFARRYVGDVDAVGRRFRWTGGSGEGPWRTVVGVVPDLRLEGPARDVRPAVLEPLAQGGGAGFLSLVFRTRDRPADVLPEARAVLRSLEERAAVLDLGTYEQWLREMPGFSDARFRALVVGLLGAVSLLLALVGVYGVTAHSVRRRTRELGIRIALGAGRPRVLAAVLGEGLALAGLGVLLGGGAAWLGAGYLESVLVGLPPDDPVVMGAVAVGLVTVSCAASVGPAVSASRVEPAEALREE